MSTALTAPTARAELARGSRSFGFAAHFLPADQWDDAARVYAFCRLVDDLADEPGLDDKVRHAALAAVDAELRGLIPPRSEVAALREVHARRGLDLDAARALVAACAGDIGGVRISDDTALLRYCYGVASTVGLLMCGVLGVRDRAAMAHAIDLGIAMQLTNLCRDVLEDARSDRVYLPATRLRRVGVDPEDLVAGTADRHAVSLVVCDLLRLAERYYDSAWDGLRDVPPRARFAILVAARVYRRIGLTLLHRGGDALAGRTVVPFRAKVSEALVAVVGFFTPRVLGLFPHPSHDASLHDALRGLPAVHAFGATHGLLDQQRI